VLVDVNLLIYATDQSSSFHDRARTWLGSALNGTERVGIPWQSIGAFLRITTNPRVNRQPFTPAQAWELVQDWLDSPLVWIPPATDRTAAVYRRLNENTPLTGNLVADGQLAALAIENGLALYSADTDFARFREVRWVNPLA
jgi:uncharacterized protein